MISYCRRRKKTQRGDTETLQCGNDTRWWCMSLYNVRGFAVVTAQFDLSVMQRKTASLFAVVIIFCVYIYTFDLSVTLCVTAVWNTMCCVSVVCRRGGGEQERKGRNRARTFRSRYLLWHKCGVCYHKRWAMFRSSILIRCVWAHSHSLVIHPLLARSSWELAARSANGQKLLEYTGKMTLFTIVLSFIRE